MEVNGIMLLDLWESVVEYLPSAKREDVAIRLVQIFADKGLDEKDFATIKGEDQHIDSAIESLFEGEEDEEDYYDYSNDDEEDY